MKNNDEKLNGWGTLLFVVILIAIFVILALSTGSDKNFSQTAYAYPWPYPPMGPAETEPQAYVFSCSRITVYTSLGPEHSDWYGWVNIKREYDGTERIYELKWWYYEPSSFGGINVWGTMFAPKDDGVYTWKAGSIMGHLIRGLPITKWIICNRQFIPLVTKERSHEQHSIEEQK